MNGRTEWRTDNLCENSDPYWPGLWSAVWINITVLHPPFLNFSISELNICLLFLFLWQVFFFANPRMLSAIAELQPHTTSHNFEIDPLGRPTNPVGSDQYFRTDLRLSPLFWISQTKQTSCENNDLITTGVTVGLAEGIIHDTSLFEDLFAKNLKFRKNKNFK